MNPLVSVIVTTYKRAGMAKTAVNSVLAQDYRPIELLLVEDGSDSDLADWLSDQLDRSNVSGQYHRHETNKGLAAARNTGLRLAKGEFISFLDDDDEWSTSKVSSQMSRLLNLPPEQRSVVTCPIEIIGSAGNLLRTVRPGNVGDLRQEIVTKGPRTTSSTGLYATEIVRRVGGFDEDLTSSIDHDFWMKLAEAGCISVNVDQALVKTIERDTRPSMMSDGTRRIAGIKAFLDKWRPTFLEWMGPGKGRKFCRRYLQRTVAMLLRSQVAQRNWSGTRKTLTVMIKASRFDYYGYWLILRNGIPPLLRAAIRSHQG